MRGFHVRTIVNRIGRHRKQLIVAALPLLLLGVITTAQDSNPGSNNASTTPAESNDTLGTVTSDSSTEDTLGTEDTSTSEESSTTTGESRSTTSVTVNGVPIPVPEDGEVSETIQTDENGRIDVDVRQDTDYSSDDDDVSEDNNTSIDLNLNTSSDGDDGRIRSRVRIRER